MKKPWSGRFSEKTSSVVESFTESVSFDYRLWKYDIEGSIAHAKMLGKHSIISKEDSEKIIKGLEEIAKEIETGKFRFRKKLEDIHMNIEASLIEKTGDAWRKLHTARSRNDQVALDLRLYLRSETKEILSLIKKFQKILLHIAIKYLHVVMPGYTHLQRAQPVLLSHHLLAYVEMLQRDVERFHDGLKRTNLLPLGSCALAGTTFPIDRIYVAKLLGFDGISENSIDAVSDRDFAIEFLSDASLLIMHLSRLAEELILWSSEEFRFIDFPDAFTTGSSIMPQKKNPDVAELIRGKTGRVYGNLLSLLTTMKGLPLSYNRDLQEDKQPVFDTVDTIKSCLTVLNEMLPGITFNAKRMYETAGDAYSTATDMAEYLVKRGLPFRKSHEITGKIVLHCMKKGKKLEELTLKELNTFSPFIRNDIYSCLKAEESVKNKKSRGSTSPNEVKRQIQRLKKVVSSK
ncbi:MAG: argininosuccinate lyase [Nitrospirae bacterium]|nr:argininosuccinate lyase [Nitrospirota bacterium]